MRSRLRNGRAMLSNLRKQIKEFAKYAEECAREAETAPSAVCDHYRKLEKYWLILAQHYLLTLDEAESLRVDWQSHSIQARVMCV